MGLLNGRHCGRAARFWLDQAIEAYGADLPVGVDRALAKPAPAASTGSVASPLPGPTSDAPSGRAAGGTTAETRTPETPAPETAPETTEPEVALERLAAELADCGACKLAQGRTQVVFGEGNPRPRVMFIGEAPGFHEDRKGRPFVGKAGQLLDRIIENAMGLRRADVYIANVNKCRPPDNRDPQPDEVAACLPNLRAQVRILQPEVIVTLGRIAAHNLLASTAPMRRLRGQDLRYEGIPVVATWHPAYLLRQPSAKADTWEDIKRVNRLLGAPEVPGR